MSMHNSGRNDTKNPGGSVGFDRLKAVYTPMNVPDSEQTLGDYIARKQKAASLDDVKKENKMTFEQWYPINKNKIGFNYDSAYIVWKAAQENV